MNCPLMKGNAIKMCGAFQVTLVLTLEDLSAFCSNSNWQNCAFYLKQQQQGQQLPIKDYANERCLMPS